MILDGEINQLPEAVFGHIRNCPEATGAMTVTAGEVSEIVWTILVIVKKEN